VERKKHPPSGSGPGKPQPGRDTSAAFEDAWDNLADGDLVELGGLGDEDPSARPGAEPISLPDLPAPVGPKPSRPPGGGGSGGKAQNRPTLSDLPVPVGPLPRKSIPDLLTPVGPRSTRAAGRPAAAVPPPSPSVNRPGSTTAPVSRTFADSAAPPPSTSTALPDELDLPAPVGPNPTKQLPDLLRPVGPTSNRSLADLPAPKGFFDDGVQPRIRSSIDLPAPKGFFDDGVQPALGGGRVQREGLEYDLALEESEPAAGSTPIVADGYLTFDGPGQSSGVAVNRPFGLDADGLDLERRDEVTPPPLPLELNDAPLPLDTSSTGSPRSRTSRMELALVPHDEADTKGGRPPDSSVVTFGRSTSGATAPPPVGGQPPRPRASDDPFAPSRAAGHLLTTEIKLQVDPTQTVGMAPLPASIAPRRPQAKVASRARERGPILSRRRLMILGSAVVTAGIVVAGFYGSRWWRSRQARDVRDASGLRQVEKLLADDSPSHWEQAAGEARQIVERDQDNTEARAVVAEASFAAALDESPQLAERVKEGDQALAPLRARTAKGPHASKAEALRAVLSTNFALAVKRFEDMKRLTPRDPDVLLYLGWALAAQEQHARAAQAFTAAIGKTKPRIPALYGLGLAQLELGDKVAAARSFQSVIDQSRDRYKRDHLGALIGLAQLAPISDRESRYQELLSRPDLAASPPRAVSRLRALAGDEALRAGRLDQARTRYQEAHALDPLDLRATVGLAMVAARSGDLAAARKQLVTDVLEAAPDHIEGALALIDVAQAEKQRDEATEIIDGLFARRPPIANAALLGRAYLARARLYESSPDPAAQAKAEAEYREAMTRADQGDFAATVGLSSLLTRLERRPEALAVLGPVKAAAQEDPALALTLGTAYLAAGQPDVAAESFKSVLARRPDDAEARYQLGHAYLAQGKFNDATDSLRRAYEIDPAREDIGLGLARTLEAGGRVRDAVVMYEQMLAPDHKPSVAVRAQAGRAFARFGLADASDAQGVAIRAVNPRDPAGMFLLGEQLYRSGKYEDALKAYREAGRLGAEAQYFEAQGRASEKLAQYDDALREYGDATTADLKYLAPRLGRGRVRLLRREYTLAVVELTAAQKVAPDSPEVLRDLGRAYVAMSDLRQGVPLLEQAAALDGRDPVTQHALGSAYYGLGRAAQSAQHLSRAVELAAPDAPWRADAFQQLGYAERAAGNRAGAIGAWRRYLAIERTDGPQRRDVQRLLMRLESK